MFGPCITRPDLCSISAATEQTDFADAVSGLRSADSYPLTSDYPLGPVMPNIARSLVEAGFTLHHRDRCDRQYRFCGDQRAEARR